MNIKTVIAIVIALLALGYGVAWYNRAPAIPPGITVEAKPAKEVAREATVPLIIDLVKVYKPEVKVKTKLPKAVIDDADQHVVASTRTPNDERQHTVTTTLDTRTGKFTTYDRAEPHPWMEVSTRRHFGAYIGAMNGEPSIAATARQEALRIKGVSVEGIAIGAMSQSERMGFVGVGVSW